MQEGKDLLKEEGMHGRAQADKFAFANILRSTETPQEKKLWKFLRTKPKGFKFRRQHPFGDYVLDFYSHKAKLIIELDGRQHKRNLEYDEERTKVISAYGLKVIRFDNTEVDNTFAVVTTEIIKYL